ncbi:MAG: AAA family ATPase [Bacteroidales bacterium]|nr:AAA family ATPase [Bacteroidales bacterium]
MKITGIHINNFQQFNDFHVNLTYPKGHKEEGKPLEKVCFIGQSGTGKTTILNIIKKLLSVNLHLHHEGVTLPEYHYAIKCKGDITFKIQNNFVTSKHVMICQNRDINAQKRAFSRIKFINFPADINLKHQFISRKTPATFNKNQRIVDFEKQKLTSIWSKVYKEIKLFNEEEANFRIDLTKRAEIENINIKEEIKNWRRGSKNPLINLANKCLNPIITNFGLEIETELPKVQSLNVIKVKSILSKKTIPFENLSTGTKQIILTGVPLYELNTDNSIILFDEPEISLYPDIQQKIIEYYTNLAPTAQFFFATHSPIIASSFEPWEIVELKFDYKIGKVFQEKYYEGERHVDNYFINPQYLRWDSILTKVFDLQERGNEKRIEKLMELATIGRKIEKEPDKSKKAGIYKEYKKLSELLDWETK